jgi:hypothetical protein
MKGPWHFLAIAPFAINSTAVFVFRQYLLWV